MRKTCTTLALAALAGLALARPAAAQPKTKPFNLTDARAALKKAGDLQLIDFGRQFPHLTLPNPCTTEFNEAVKAAKAEQTACLDISNPPAGSPYADFNANAAQFFTTCGDISLDACMDKLAKAQAKFCALNAAKELSRAKTTLARCCAPLSQRKVELQKELAAIEADVQSCLGH